MGIFKRKSRKDKRGIVPAETVSPVPLWESYDGGGESDPYDRTPVTYGAPEPSYDRSPTAYDSAPSSSSSNDSSPPSPSGGGE